MKRIALLICSTTILFACNSSDKKDNKDANKDTATGTTADVKTDDHSDWVPVDSATAMKAWMETATPGDMHKWLATMNGTWNGDVTMWESEGGAPMTSKSKMVNKMIMDGRYQVSEYSGDMMGAPFTGMSTTGYDNYQKKFISTWIDNMGTGIMTMEGTYDPASKSLSTSGTFKNPANGKNCEMKEKLTIVDDKHYTLEMWGTDMKTGKTYKNMEMKFTKG